MTVDIYIVIYQIPAKIFIQVPFLLYVCVDLTYFHMKNMANKTQNKINGNKISRSGQALTTSNEIFLDFHPKTSFGRGERSIEEQNIFICIWHFTDQARGYKTFFMLNSAVRNTVYILLINVKMPTMVGTLTSISRINDWLW